jgi:hypothetical protein
MPNYCNNTLTIRGNQKQLYNFFLKNENIEHKQQLDLSKSVPRPKDCYMGDLGPEEIYKYGRNNWYDTQIKIWGTKWNCTDVTMTRDKNTLTYTFLTAWSPPKKWLITTAEIFDELIFELKYEEPGNDYYGTLSIEYGGITEDIEGELSGVMEMVFSTIDDELIQIIENHFSSENDTLKAISKKTSCDDVNNLICNFTPTLENIKSYKNVNIKNYPSNDHVLYEMMEEIQRYFENLQDKTLSEHPEIAFDECYCEIYMEKHFEDVYSKYFNNNDVKNKILNIIDPNL